MIRHTVLFNLKQSAVNADIDRAFAQLSHLKTMLPGFIRVAWGECTFHGDHVQSKRVYGFSIDFENQDAYNAFLNNPVTEAAKISILHIVEGEMNGIYGFDIGKSFGPAPNPSPLDKYRAPVPRLLPPGVKWT